MKKRIVSIICFWLIAIFLFSSISNVMIPTWNDKSGMPTKRTNAFYAEEQNTIDAMVFGSSYCYYSFSPLPIWNNYGFTTYSFGNPAQRIWTTYYYMEEAFKYQRPKVVFFEVGTADKVELCKEEHNRENLDTLKFSWTKLKAIFEITGRGNETVASYVLPGLRYHTRWKELTEDDFSKTDVSNYFGKGSLSKFGTKPASRSRMNKWMTDTGENLVFPEENEKYIDKMIALCEKNDAKLVFVRFPEVTWTKNKHEMIAAMAEEKGVPFLDYNTFPEAYGLDWKTDTSDKGEHMNIVGSEKVSNYLGQYLKDNYGFEDKRKNPAFADWNENYAKFQEVYAKNEIANIVSLNRYLEKIQEDCYLAVITYKGNAVRRLYDKTKVIMREMGMDEAAVVTENCSYIGILNGGEFEYQKTSAVEMLTWKNQIEDIKLDVTSAGAEIGNVSSIIVDDKEYSANDAGFNIVVYDKDLKRVVDSVSFNTTKRPYSMRRKLQNNALDEF